MDVLYDSTLGGTAANFDATGLAGTYKNLKILLSARGNKNAFYTRCSLIFNNDSTAAHYAWQQGEFSQNGAPAASADTSDPSILMGYVSALNAPAGAAGNLEITVYDYASTTFNKTLTYLNFFRSQTTVTELSTGGGEWFSTAAITRVTVAPDSDSFIAGSRMTVYGF